MLELCAACGCIHSNIPSAIGNAVSNLADGPNVFFEHPRVFTLGENTVENPLALPDLTTAAAGAQIARLELKYDDNNPVTGLSGSSGFDTNALGTPGTVTYGYLEEPDILLAEQFAQYRPFTLTEISGVEYAISLWADVANVEFIRTTNGGGVYIDNPDDAQLALLGQDTTGGGLGGPDALDGDTITSSIVRTAAIGVESVATNAFQTVVHEIGHALGLSHPGDYNGSDFAEEDIEYFQDTYQYTVMSYRFGQASGADYGGRTPTGLMLHDIAAIQYLYGKNNSAFLGNTNYGHNSNTGDQNWTFSGASDYVISSIWDSGGEDTIDVSEYAQAQLIDLREESFSSIGGLIGGLQGHLKWNVSIAAGTRIENAVGGSGDDVFIGNTADASFVDAQYLDLNGAVIAGAVTGATGDNVFDGRDGNDVVSYAFAFNGVSIDLAQGTTFDLGQNGTDTFLNIESFIGTDFADTLGGDGADNNLYGGAGADSFLGTSGIDVLVGGTGTDAVSFSGADADFFFAVYADSFSAASLGGDVTVGVSIEEFTASAGDDLIVFSGQSGATDGGIGNDTILGGSGADSLVGGVGNDLLVGDAGSGALNGLAVEVANGSAGNDTLTGSNAADRMLGGAGSDFIIANGGDDFLDGGAGLDILFGGAGNDTVIGDGNGDALYGDDGDDVLRVVGGGDYQVNGGEGNDQIFLSPIAEAGDGSPLVFGNGGDDLIIGGVQNDQLYGGAGNDSISGGAGDDALFSNIFGGDAGIDTLTGGDGKDSFVIRGEAGVFVTITDFTSGADVIDLLSNNIGDPENLILTQSGEDVLIGFAGETFIRVENATIEALDGYVFF